MHVGDLVILKDANTVEFNISQGNPLHTQSLIKSIEKYDGDICQWTLYYLDDVILLHKEVDDLEDWRIYFPVEGIKFGTVEDWLDNGQDWLFRKKRKKLDYAKKIVSDKGEYERQGILQAYKEDIECLVVEWSGPNELIAFQTGEYIEFYEGYNISESDFEVLNK